MILCLVFWADQGFCEQKYRLGDIPLHPETYKKHQKAWPMEMAEFLPTAYDARDDRIVTPAKNQAACGSCWAFASVGAMESHMLKAYGAGPEDLSEQQQVSCNTDMYGCGGGNSTAILYWELTGPLYESCFPYTALDTTLCEEAGCEQLGFRVIDWHTVAPGDFKNSLYTYGPSYWRFDVHTDFYTFWGAYSPGAVYVNQSRSFEGGHAVLLIGWDDGKGAYLCKNSWGGGGPNGDGTFWIAYAGHANDLSFGMANFSLTSLTCSFDSECDDGIYCNGLETCTDGACQDGTPVACPDDRLFCSGAEVCNESAQECGTTGPPCGEGTTCNEDTDECDLLSCGNGTCDPGEDCNNCSDCISGTGGGTCGACFKGKCDGVCHPVKEGPECSDCAPSYCCGDGVCDNGEDSFNCPLDCGVPAVCGDGTCDPDEDPCNCSQDCGNPPAEVCNDGVDNDCNGAVDCDDGECDTDPACACKVKKETCQVNEDCCSNRCSNKKVCL
jgi:hypothetical protein